MDNRPTTLRSRRICRFCLTENEPLSFIYERDHSKPFYVPLPLKIMSCVSIEVYSADGMPQIICSTCKKFLELSYKFKHQCRKADEALRSFPLSGVLPRPFPPIITEVPDRKRPLDHSSSGVEVKKPRVDNGDRERERERDQKRQEIYKNEQSQDSVEDDEEDVEVGKEPGEVRVYPCDQCDRTFSLRQSLQLHIEQQHRDRNSKCNICDRMFFTKYDLQKHMATHTEEKPFSCSVCSKSFTRANLLQRHEKIHREDLRFSCQHCDREFFSQEDLEKHEDTSHKSAKPFQCNICSKRFTYKQGLERHEMLHAEDKSFVCEYCKEAFQTSTKLARHLQTHAGHRPFPCKLCSKNFLLSHHLTRHMRTHSVEKNHVCDECGKAFKRKESLEVHQLTHVKRGGIALTCDVCHETCRNRADYVTHIKQHIEAGEKMGPDGLQPDLKEKVEVDSEDEEEEQFSDNDDDYEPPAYMARKFSKKRSDESEEEMGVRESDEKDKKDQVIYMRGKDGQLVKKTIKTMVPMSQPQTQPQTQPQRSNNTGKPTIISQKKLEDVIKKDETEAEVQKIVASVFQEHKIPLKGKEKDEKTEKSEQKSTVKVIKRVIVRKPGGDSKETEVRPGSTSNQSKVTKRVIVRRIIRQGDTTREVIMNPDGTLLDPSELAKLPTGNVVKRVVVKKTGEKHSEMVSDTPKFELKTSEGKEEKPEGEINKETVESLQKTVAEQKLKIAELEARKHEYESMDDMLPERRDSEDEQELPLKRVFVKRKQSIYDEEQEYHDESPKVVEAKPVEVAKEKSVFVKAEDTGEFEQMDREIDNMLGGTEATLKKMDSVLGKEIEGLDGGEVPSEAEKEPLVGGNEEKVEEAKSEEELIKIEKFSQETITESQNSQPMEVEEGNNQAVEQENIFEAVVQEKANEVVAAVDQAEGVVLNDSHDSQDSLEDKLSQMEG